MFCVCDMFLGEEKMVFWGMFWGRKKGYLSHIFGEE